MVVESDAYESDGTETACIGKSNRQSGLKHFDPSWVQVDSLAISTVQNHYRL